MATIITYDAPGFEARVETAGNVVCILSTAAQSDRVIQARVRRLMHGQGIDCRICAGCPVGRAE